MKNKIKILIVITILTVLIIATIFSIFKFQVINPFSSCFSMLRILFTDTEYVEVQNYPKKVVFSKGNNSKTLLDEYMNSKGFYEIPEEQMGSTLVYGNSQQKHFIFFSMNMYYSKWIWDKIETLPADNNT